MGAEQSYFIVPVTSGLCIEPNRSSHNLLYTKIPNAQNQNQHWVLERQGNKVAFRNVAGKDYLQSLGSRNKSQVRMQSSPHWWSLEPGRTAGSFWIKSDDTGGYLCNPFGRHEENNQQWMWSWQEPQYTQRLLFYLQDIRSLNSSPDVVLSGGPAAQGTVEQAQAKEKEVKEGQEKEAQLAAKEKEIAEKEKKLNELDAKEKELEQRQKDLDAKQAEVVDKQKKVDGLAEKQRKLDIRQAELEARQKAAAEKQAKLEERERKVAAKEASPGSPGKSGKGSEKAQTQLKELQAQLAEASKALEEARQREESLAARASSRSVSSPQEKQTGTGSAREDDLARAQEENARLQARLQEMASETTSVSSKRGMSIPTGDSDPSSDERWRPTAPLAAGAQRSRPPGLRTDHDHERDPRWRSDAPLAEGTLRKAVPGLRTGGGHENDSRWTANAPAAARTNMSEPEGMRTKEKPGARRDEVGDIVMPHDFGFIPRLKAS